MKGFIKTWWHCLFRTLKDLDKGGHRMAKITFKDRKLNTWVCSCYLKAKYDWFMHPEK